jgi:hypothetical protein
MGQRFARKACVLIDPDLKLDERVFKEVFFDSSDDVKTHAGLGKQVSGTLLPEDAGAIARPVDGRYARADASDPAWVTIAPQAAAVELIADLGEATTIDVVAINLLVSPQSPFPKKMIFSVSEDGKTYRVNSGRHSTVTPPRGPSAQAKAETTQTALVVVGQGNAKARYVKIEITTTDRPMLVDEVIVNPQP